MTLFLQTILSFPVVIYTTLLLIFIFIWLIGAIDIFHVGGVDAHGDIDICAFQSISGLFFKLKISEIPSTVILTLTFLFAWLSSYIFYRTVQMTLSAEGILYFGVGVINFILSGAIGLLMTSIILRPFNQKLAKLNPQITHKTLLGSIVVVRSSVVNADKGEGVLDDGGAGMILQLRCFNDRNALTRNSEAIIVRYESNANYYEVIEKKRFF